MRSLFAALILLSTPLLAADAPQASGKFKGSKYSFEVGGAYAFWSHSADDGPLIEVAVSNDSFKTDAFDAFFDPKPVIDTNFADDQTRARWAKREKEGKLDAWLDYREDKVHWHLKDAHIVRGYVRGDQVVLLVKGTSPSIDKVHGQVALTRESGKWKIADEIYEVGE